MVSLVYRQRPRDRATPAPVSQDYAKGDPSRTMTSPSSASSPVGTNPGPLVDPASRDPVELVGGPRALGPHQLRDLPDDRRAVAAA